MLRAAATGLIGFGVTVASTFAGSLGLSLHMQRVAFAVGVVVMVIGVVLFWRGRRSKPTDTREDAPAQAGASTGAATFADALAELHSHGHAIRERVKPKRVPVHEILSRAVRAPVVAGLAQQEAARWDVQVSDALTRNARRYVPEWDGVARLPPNSERLPGVPMFTADARAVAAFLDAKLALLRRIINELGHAPVVMAMAPRTREPLLLSEEAALHAASAKTKRASHAPRVTPISTIDQMNLIANKQAELRAERIARESVPDLSERAKDARRAELEQAIKRGKYLAKRCREAQIQLSMNAIPFFADPVVAELAAIIEDWKGEAGGYVVPEPKGNWRMDLARLTLYVEKHIAALEGRLNKADAPAA